MKKITFNTNIAKSDNMTSIELEIETGYFFACKNIKFVAVKEKLRPQWCIYELSTGKEVTSLLPIEARFSRKLAISGIVERMANEHHFNRVIYAMKKHPIVNL